MSALDWVYLSQSRLELLCGQKVILVAHPRLFGSGLQPSQGQPLVPQKPYKQDTTSADAVAVPGGSSATTDRFYDLSIKVAGIERSMSYLEAHAETADKKLDKLSDDYNSAKATFNTLKFLFIAICAGTWAVISGLILLWARHHFNW